MDKLKQKGITYLVGYIFFLIIGIIGISFQMYKYIKGDLGLVSEDYWFNPELLITGLFTLFIFRPMGLVEIIEIVFKGIANKILK